MSLLKSPSWVHLVEMVGKQVQGRLNELGIRPLFTNEEVLHRNYKLGIAHGMQLVIRLPNDIYSELHDAYTKKLEEFRDESARNTTES